jgi:hypothetical protein
VLVCEASSSDRVRVALDESEQIVAGEQEASKTVCFVQQVEGNKPVCLVWEQGDSKAVCLVRALEDSDGVEADEVGVPSRYARRGTEMQEGCRSRIVGIWQCDVMSGGQEEVCLL